MSTELKMPVGLQMPTERESPKNNARADGTATRLAAMAVNPYLLHVYWQIPGRDPENIQDTLGESLANARPVLRFYDITCILFDGTNAHQVFDVEVDLRTRKWNVPIWSADKSYLIDLGYKAPDGRFYRIGRSNIVRVPRSGPSLRVAERSLRVERGRNKGLMPASSTPVPAGEPVEAPRLETINGTLEKTGELFKSKAERVNAADRDLPKHALVRDTPRPLDLVQMTEEKFSSGVSSMPPAQGTNS
jgi:hypothetical protein